MVSVWLSCRSFRYGKPFHVDGKESSLPQEWKVRQRAFGSEQRIGCCSAKRIYSAIIPFKLPVISSQLKWNEPLQIGENGQEGSWNGIYTSPYHALRDTKLQSFHFKITHRNIPCNKFLCNIRIRREDTCSYCKDSDTLQHFFLHCTQVRRFWDGLLKWLEDNVNIHIIWDEKELLFGIPRWARLSRNVNFILLHAKFFMYRQRLFHLGKLELIHFLRYIHLK